MQLNPIPHQEGRDPPSITYQEVWFPISLCHHLIVGKTTLTRLRSPTWHLARKTYKYFLIILEIPHVIPLYIR